MIYRTPNWEDFVHVACHEIRACGAGNVQVARRMRAMLDNLVASLPPYRHAGARTGESDGWTVRSSLSIDTGGSRPRANTRLARARRIVGRTPFALGPPRAHIRRRLFTCSCASDRASDAPTRPPVFRMFSAISEPHPGTGWRLTPHKSWPCCGYPPYPCRLVPAVRLLHIRADVRFGERGYLCI